MIVHDSDGTHRAVTRITGEVVAKFGPDLAGSRLILYPTDHGKAEANHGGRGRVDGM
jgi:hypothetical protein